MKFTIVSFSAILFVLVLSKDTAGRPHSRKKRETAVNNYDLGVLDTCATPSLSVCRNYVDYQVPGVLAEQRIVAIKEALIMAAYTQTKSNQQDGFNSTLCAEAYLELECRNQFPRCDEDAEGARHVTFSDRSCQRLTSQCSQNLANRFVAEGFCSLNTTEPIGQCKRTSEYSGYQFCNTIPGWGDWYITDWMHLYLQKIEREIAAFSDPMHGNSEVCIKRFTQFKCESVGRCWDQGRKAELIPSRDDCNNVVNCFPSYLKGAITESMQCHTWPRNEDKPSTTATPITTQETTPTRPISVNQAQPDQVTFPSATRFSSAPSTLHHLLVTQLTLILGLAVLVLCVH